LARRSSDHEIITVSENLTEFPVLVFCFDKIAIDTKEEVILPNVPSIFDHGPVVETKGENIERNTHVFSKDCAMIRITFDCYDHFGRKIAS